MKVFKDVLKKNRLALILFFIFAAVSLTVFLLYDIILEPFIYSAVIALFFLCVFILADFLKESKMRREREHSLQSILFDWKDLPEPQSLSEQDYQEMIALLGGKIDELTENFTENEQDRIDYYTSWVHQIKTPIAVMKFKLSDDTPENRALSAELFRIEQYVEMVLQYIRLDSDSNDLVIREYSLDEIIRESLHKFAPQFIEKKLRLEYSPAVRTVVTDRKWFSCILDQLLSNAVKYTPSGTVSVSAQDDILTVSDTGIGIAAEDLPRIFEKGYTGCNGRTGRKSSGLGLYLAKKAADMLALDITAKSVVGEGSTFSIKAAGEKG